MATVGEISRYYHPELLGKKKLKGAKAVLLYLLPYTSTIDVESSLESLPYPVITMRMPFQTQWRESIFPQDMGVVIDRTFFTLSSRMTEIRKVFAQTGIPEVAKRICVTELKNVPDGGSIAVSPDTKDVLTTDRKAIELYTHRGYRTYCMPSRHLLHLHRAHKDDWTHMLPTHIDPVVAIMKEDAETTVFMDEHVYHANMHGRYPRTWSIIPVNHADTMAGFLNLSFLGKTHVLAPQEMEGTQFGKRVSRKRKVIYQPQVVVSDYAGAKCRSLLLPLYPEG